MSNIHFDGSTYEQGRYGEIRFSPYFMIFSATPETISPARHMSAPNTGNTDSKFIILEVYSKALWY